MEGATPPDYDRKISSPESEWEVENVGVAPDIEVEMTPKVVIAGHDPQLEKAVIVDGEHLATNKTPGKLRGLSEATWRDKQPSLAFAQCSSYTTHNHQTMVERVKGILRTQVWENEEEK